MKWKKFLILSLSLCLCLGSFCFQGAIGQIGKNVKASEYPFSAEDLGDLADELTSFWDGQSYLSSNYVIGSFAFSEYNYSVDVRTNIYIEFNLTESFWQNYSFWESFPVMSPGYYSGRHKIIGYDENNLEVHGYIQFNSYAGARQLRFYDAGNVLIASFIPSNLGSYRVNLSGFSRIISFSPENASIPSSTFEIFSSQASVIVYVPKLYTVYEYLCYIYDLAYETGQNDFSSEHYENGYNNGYNDGYNNGYNDGYNTGISGTVTTNWFTSFVNSIFDILNIEIFPNVRLIYLVFIPIGLGVLALILKLIRG